MGKKGISNIIVTLVMVVLGLVAVGIVWGTMKNIIEEGAEQIDLGKFTLDLEIKSVKIEGDDVTVDVIVQRNPGLGEFIGMNFVFSDGQESEIIREDTVLKELEEKSFTYTLTKINTSELEDVSIVPIYELSSGKENMGNIADKFDVVQGSRSSGVTGGAVEELSNFEALGFKGAGRMEFGPFSSDIPKLPEFRKAIVDPVDVLPGDNQTFTVHAYSPSGVINITSMTELDNSTLNLNFIKVSEYEENNETIEIWSISWIVNDVHTETYRTTINATDSEGNENSITLTWTDSCQSQITHGTTETISTCTAATVDGVDGGSVTITGTLTIPSGATWRFNSGQSITVTGTISMAGGKIEKGNLYYTDSDSDGYAVSATLKTSSSSAVRAKDATGVSDCLDSDSDVYQNVNFLWLDSDKDRWVTGNDALRCVGDKTSYWYKDTDGVDKWIVTGQALGGDCDDGNINVQQNKYYDEDWDGYCLNSGTTCVASGAGSPYRTSCSSYTDCDDADVHVYQSLGSIGLDVDQDRHSVGGAGTWCVGDKSSWWYEGPAGVYKWIKTTEDLGVYDCNDANSGVTNLEWGSGALQETLCYIGDPGSNLVGQACTPVSSTNTYYTDVGEGCGGCGGPSTCMYKYEQTCQTCTSGFDSCQTGQGPWISHLGEACACGSTILFVCVDGYFNRVDENANCAIGGRSDHCP